MQRDPRLGSTIGSHDTPSSHARITHALRAAGCVFAQDEATLLTEAFEGDALADAVNRRVVGTPLEQILGWAEFGGLRVIVRPGVFVPRRRTELLVTEAVRLTPHVVLDICCGSGAVGAAVSQRLSHIELHATDIDPVATACAQLNVPRATVYTGDLYSSLPQHLRSRFDVVIANAPYVPTGAIASMPAEARDHEPRAALDGGEDGLDLHRRIADGVRDWLTPSGHLLIETGLVQAERTADIVDRAGLTPRIVRSDEVDGTIVVGSRP